jgi:iron complex outermembrane recepter protein
LELEVTAEPIRKPPINASTGLYKWSSNGSIAVGSAAYIDPSAREQPRWSFSSGVQYAIDLKGAGSVTPRLDMFYQGRRTNGNVNFPQIPGADDVPSYVLFNARITYTSDDGKWSFSASAQNLFDKFYWDQLGSAADNTPGPTYGNPIYARSGVPGRPREFAFTLRRNL